MLSQHDRMGGSMDWNWWLFRGLFSRRVLGLVGPVVSFALLWAFFVGPFSDWTMKVIEDRLMARAERRADLVRDALDLPSPDAPQTLRFAVPRSSAREVVRELEDTGYAVDIRSEEGARWRVIVRGVPRNLVAGMQDRVSAASPRARLLP